MHQKACVGHCAFLDTGRLWSVGAGELVVKQLLVQNRKIQVVSQIQLGGPAPSLPPLHCGVGYNRMLLVGWDKPALSSDF